MTFLGILGAPRTGKTLLATIIAIQLYKQNKLNKRPFYIFANYHFLDEMKPIAYYIDNPKSYLQIKLPELNQGLAIFDELWAWAMSRGSGTSIVNKFMTQITFQSGKRGLDTMWTAQRSKSADINVRSQTYKFFKTRIPNDEYYRYNYVSSTYYEGKKVLPLKIPKATANQYYKFYDTREIIKTLTPEDLEQDSQPIDIIPQETGTAGLLLDLGIGEIDDNLDAQSQKEIQEIEENLSKVEIKPKLETVDERITQQNQEEAKLEYPMKQLLGKKIRVTNLMTGETREDVV